MSTSTNQQKYEQNTYHRIHQERSTIVQDFNKMVIFLLSCITGDGYLKVVRKSLVFDRHIIFYRTQLLYRCIKRQRNSLSVGLLLSLIHNWPCVFGDRACVTVLPVLAPVADYKSNVTRTSRINSIIYISDILSLNSYETRVTV